MSELRKEYYEYLRNHATASEITLHVMELEDQNKEMLDALIYVYDERMRDVDNGLTDRMMKGVIEKQTGKKIEEILTQ